MALLTYENLIYAITVLDAILYAVLVYVFWRMPLTPVMRALTIYFGVMLGVYLLATLVEGPLDTEVGNKLWAEWRALFFRGGQAVASGWLVWKLTTRK